MKIQIESFLSASPTFETLRNQKIALKENEAQGDSFSINQR